MKRGRGVLLFARQRIAARGSTTVDAGSRRSRPPANAPLEKIHRRRVCRKSMALQAGGRTLRAHQPSNENRERASVAVRVTQDGDRTAQIRCVRAAEIAAFRRSCTALASPGSAGSERHRRHDVTRAGTQAMKITRQRGVSPKVRRFFVSFGPFSLRRDTYSATIIIRGAWRRGLRRLFTRRQSSLNKSFAD